MKKLFKIQLLCLIFMSTILFGSELIQGGGNDNGAVNKNLWSHFGNTYGSLDRSYNAEQFIYATPKDTGSGMYQSFTTEVGKDYEVNSILIGSDTNRREVFNGESYLTVSSAPPVQSKASVIAESEHVTGASETNVSFVFTATSTTSYLALRSDRQWHYASARAISVKAIGETTIPATIDNPPLTREELRELLENWNNVRHMGNQEVIEEYENAIINANTSQITDMSSLFRGVLEAPGGRMNFTLNIRNWDVSNVTSMAGMFYATTFDQDISNWDVSSVTNMSYMFSGSEYNQPLNNWDVSNVTSMSYMFYSTGFSGIGDNFGNPTQFNQPLNNWDVSNVTNMSYMFATSQAGLMSSGTASFNQNIRTWDVSNVVDYDDFASFSILEDQHNPFITNVTPVSTGAELIHDAGNENGVLKGSYRENTQYWEGSFTMLREHNGVTYLLTGNEQYAYTYQSFTTEVGKEYEVKATLIGADVNRRGAFTSGSVVTIAEQVPTTHGSDEIATSLTVTSGTATEVNFTFTATSTTSYVVLRGDSAWRYPNVSAVSVKELQ